VAESAARLMYLRVYDSRDISHHPTPSPSLSYSLTHPHRSIGYRNRNPQLLTESVVRLMYLRVYGSRDRSSQVVISPSLSSSLTYTHRSIGHRNHKALNSLHPPRPYTTYSHMHTVPSPHPRCSRSHTLRYFGFLSV
jgi:hypothetical protein